MRPIRAYAPLLLAAVAGGALTDAAVADCRVQYGYHTGNGADRETRRRNVVLDPGESRSIGRNQMDFVKLRNSSTHSVRVVLNNKSFQLDKGNVDPPFGFYLTPTRLVRLECLNSESPAGFASAEQMAQAARLAGDSAVATATAVRAAFNTGRNQMAILLQNAGFAAEQVASALKQVYSATAAQVAAAMEAAGFGLAQIASGIRAAFNMGLEQAAQVMFQINATAREAVAALRPLYNATREQMAQALRAAGFTAAQIGAALSEVYNATIEQVAAALNAAGFAVDQVVAALQATFSPSLQELTRVLRGIGASLEDIADVLRRAGNDIGAVAQALFAVVRDPSAVVAAIIDAFEDVMNRPRNCGVAGCPEYQLYEALLAARAQLGDLVSDFRSRFRASAGVAARYFVGVLRQMNRTDREMRQMLQRALLAAGYRADEVKQALDAALGNARRAAVPAPRLLSGYIGSPIRGRNRCSDVHTTVGMTPQAPILLPLGTTTTITFLAEGLLDDIRFDSLPSGASVRVSQKSGCDVTVVVDMTRSRAREGSTGRMQAITPSHRRPWSYWEVSSQQNRMRRR